MNYRRYVFYLPYRLAVGARRQSDHAPEDLAKGRFVAVADLPGDLDDRQGGGLQQRAWPLILKENAACQLKLAA